MMIHALWPSYQFKLASTVDEINAYFALRCHIFCQEQDLFVTHDVDEYDDYAYPIVAVDPTAEVLAGVVGIVRIYESQQRYWFGGRLGVHPQYRRQGSVGKGLIYKAVTTAHGWGCDQFRATVQMQNVRFFRRLHWTSLQQIEICQRPHHLMEANLDHYPPIFDGSQGSFPIRFAWPQVS